MKARFCGVDGSGIVGHTLHNSAESLAGAMYATADHTHRDIEHHRQLATLEPLVLMQLEQDLLVERELSESRYCDVVLKACVQHRGR